MEVYWIPIIGEVFGTLLVIGVVAAVLHYRLKEQQARVEAEMGRMERAYQHARESLRR